MSDPLEVLQRAIAEHKPVKIFALFSSGNDSLVSTHFAMNHGATEVLLCNTGFGIKESREHWFATVCQHGWNCRMAFPPSKTYRDFVLKYGFPGPAAHRYAYVWLKERALRRIIRETKRSTFDRVMLVTGVRNQESARRMGYVEPIQRQGAAVWVAPFYDYDARQRDEYIEQHGLIRSPVSDLIHKSGECMCGAFAEGDRNNDLELRELEMWYPAMAKEIWLLQREAEAVGVHAKWGHRPPRVNLTGKLAFMPMCVGCGGSTGEKSQ